MLKIDFGLLTKLKRAKKSPYEIISTSNLLDPVWYRETHADLRGTAVDSARHYLAHGAAEGRDPHPLFDTKYYLRMNPDVRRSGINPLVHYIVMGAAERKDPHPNFDTEWYLKQLPAALDRELSALEHYLTIGQKLGYSIYPEHVVRDSLSSKFSAGEPLLQKSSVLDENVSVSPPHELRIGSEPEVVDAAKCSNRYMKIKREVTVIWRQTVEKFVERAVPAISIRNYVNPIDEIIFPFTSNPKVSIILPCFNEYEYTVEALLSISKYCIGVQYEVILADDCSTDARFANFVCVDNLRIVRPNCNQGFLLNCNDAYKHCRGDYIFLLNNDAQLTPGALISLIEVLESDPQVGAAGPKILFPNGRLQEAGCSIAADGNCTMVGVHEDPNQPKYSYDRDVHYISGAALLLRRNAIGPELFDTRFAPAYFEDADLCTRLRDSEWRIRYCASAIVIHHLSASSEPSRKMGRIAINRQKFLEKWGRRLRRDAIARTIAFYLPQYHAAEVNDRLWGKGFTEWHNVTKSEPCFVGHVQPHLPTDLGFYDLRVPDTLAAQASLARRYGIAAFCLYYYNFGSKRPLYKPFETIKQNPNIDFPFCVCWANENWTRHWDGGEREVVLEQLYDEETLNAVIADFLSLANDPRYFKINGMPLFMIYRPRLVPHIRSVAARIRSAFADCGFPGVHLVYVESMETVNGGVSPNSLGFDACVEFPPHGIAVNKTDHVELLKPNWTGKRYSYPETVLNSIVRRSEAYPRYPAVFPSWDNSARQPRSGTVFEDVSPEVFQAYAESKLDEVHASHIGDNRLIFVNAWNEWAEGDHLEPDRRYGHRFLEALRNALVSKMSI